MDERAHHDTFYAADADRILRGELIGHVHRRIVRDFLRRAALDRTSRVLSLGCGEGTIERILAPSVGSIVGYDVSPVAVELARSRAAEAGLANVRFEVADLLEVGSLLESEPYDAACAFAFLHHLSPAGLARTLGLVFDALRAEGVFLTVDPSVHRLVKHLRVLVRTSYERHHSPDEQELDPRALATLLARVGFSDVDVRHADFFISPLGWLAPGLPPAAASPLAWLDAGLCALPGVRRYSSSFSIAASKPPTRAT